MGWRINLVENQLPISTEIEQKINALPAHLGATARDGSLYFNRDHLEHMDYVWNDEVLNVLREGRVHGRVLFSSSEGDNRGRTWGYDFEDGEMTKLVRADGEWVPDSIEEGTDLSAKPTGNRPDDLKDAKIGDTIAVGFIFMGLTSYE